jgi:hypothetical protein
MIGIIFALILVSNNLYAGPDDWNKRRKPNKIIGRKEIASLLSTQVTYNNNNPQKSEDEVIAKKIRPLKKRRPLAELEWSSAHHIFICKQCLQGFSFDQYKYGRRHNCLSKTPIKFYKNEMKFRCKKCKMHIAFHDRTLFFHTCPS